MSTSWFISTSYVMCHPVHSVYSYPVANSSLQQLTNNIFDGLEYVEEKVAEAIEDAKKLWDAQSAAIERRRKENNEKYTQKRNRISLNKART